MKEFAIAYELNGKKTFARYEGNSADEAKSAFLNDMPNVKVNDVIELDDNLKKLLDVVKPKEDKELAAIKADVEKNKVARDAEERKEELRKSKFKYAKNMFKQLDPEKKEYLLNLADDVMRTDKDFRKDVWKKLIDKFLSPAEAREMQKEFEADAKENWKNDKVNLNRELEVIRRVFGNNKGKHDGDANDAKGVLTFDQIATVWGCSKVYAIKVYQQAMKKLVAKILKKDVASDEEVKAFQDKINELNKKAKDIARQKAAGQTDKAKEAEKQAKAAEKEFNQLLKDLNDVRVKFKLPKVKYYARTFAPSDAHIDAYAKPDNVAATHTED